MADDSDSPYGMLDYGEEYYSYAPVWLFESDAVILFQTEAAFGFTMFFEANIQIPITVTSFEYIGPFWVLWFPEIPIPGRWIPVGPDLTPNEEPING